MRTKRLIYAGLLWMLILASMTVTFVIVLNTIANAAELSWSEPTTNVDGSCYTDSDGWDFHWGIVAGVYTDSLRVQKIDPNVTNIDSGIDAGTGCGNIFNYNYNLSLSKGTWFVAMEAIDTSGNKSDFSNEVSPVIKGGPSPPTNLIEINLNGNINMNVNGSVTIN